MHRRGKRLLLTLVLAAALTAGCGGSGSGAQSSGAQESAQEEAAQESAPESEQAEAEAPQEEEAAPQEETAAPQAEAATQAKAAETSENLPPYTVVVPEEKTEIAQPIPVSTFYGQYFAEKYLITPDENPDVLSTIENLSYMDLKLRRFPRTVASVPVSATFRSANELNQLTVLLQDQEDWDTLYAALKEENPDTADEYLENIRELCNTGIVDLTFAEESGRTHGYNSYMYTLDGETMTCVPIEGLNDNYTIQYNQDAAKLSFHVEFRGDILRMENGDCSVALLPYGKWVWCTDSSVPYLINAAVENSENAYENIVSFNSSWSNAFAEKASLMMLTFADGSTTDIETTEAVRTEPNTLTVTWTIKCDANGKSYEDPGSITVRYLHPGGLNPLFIIVDDEGKLYFYDRFPSVNP